LQQRGTLQTEAAADDPHFYVQILRRPAWLLGIAVTALGAAAQLYALNKGSLVAVQPILTLSLVFALPFGVLLTHQRVGRREVVAALVVIVGLTLFLWFAQPAGGVHTPTTASWIIALVIIFAVAATATALSRGRSAPAVAALLGVAAGVCFGGAAALSKLFTEYAGNGVVAILEQWTTYALIVVALAGGLLQQAALKTAVLPPAMSAINVANMLASITLGLVVFKEDISTGGGRLALSLLALALTVGGVLTLVWSQNSPPADSPTAAQHGVQGVDDEVG